MPLFHKWVQKAFDSAQREEHGRIYLDQIKYYKISKDEKGREYIEYLNPPITAELINCIIQTYEDERLKWVEGEEYRKANLDAWWKNPKVKENV